MDQKLVINDTIYDIVAEQDNPEMFAQLAKAMEIFYELDEKFKAVEEEHKLARYRMGKMFTKGNQEAGLSKMANRYIGITYVPGTDGKTEMVKVLDAERVKEIMEEFGVPEEEYTRYEEKTTGKRKESIRVSTK